MATLIPSLSSCVGRIQAGERRFARRMETHLEDDYLCWYEMPVGKRQRYSDFIILHPARGLLLLEVKDWKLDTIQKIDATTATIKGHDFEPDWLELVVGMVDPETSSLLLLYDDAQSIYSRKSQLDFSLSSVGVQARGRTTVLKLNY